MKQLAKSAFAALSVSLLLAGCGDSGISEDLLQNSPNGVVVMASAVDLPKCSEDHAGEKYLVKEDGTFYGCTGEEWVRLGQSMVTDTFFIANTDTFYVNSYDTLALSAVDTLYSSIPADYSCETKPLADKKGVIIYCEGDSIGVVYNGTKGEPGEKGETGPVGATGASGAQGIQGVRGQKGGVGTSGKDCFVASSTDSTVTVVCGEVSFTMNLNKNKELAVKNINVTGFALKGPFMYGSKVMLYELADDPDLSQTEHSYSGTVIADDGRFTVRNVSLESGYARLEATGLYRNEVTGKTGNARITLKAYVDLNDRQTANVNLLTHLESYRVEFLMKNSDGKLDLKTAKKQAQKEILASIFDVDASSYVNSEDLLVQGASEGDALLLALSVMLQGNRDETEMMILLDDFGRDIQTDGIWDGSIRNNSRNWRDSIAEWAFKSDLVDSLSKIRNHIRGWGLSEIVPDFENVIRTYYSKNLGLGLCNNNTAGNLTYVANAKSKYYAARYSSTADVGGSIRFICDDVDSLGNAFVDGYKWRVATNIEKDTAGLQHGSLTTHKQGSVVKGLVNSGYVYVYEGKHYRRGTAYDMSLGLDGCTAARRDSVVKSGTIWYKCAEDAAVVVDGNVVAQAWRPATTIEKDTLNWSLNGDSYVDGMVMIGNVTNSMYIYQKSQNQWREATTQEIDTHYLKTGLAWIDTVDGAYKKGEKTGTYYVFDSENGGWRAATSNLEYSYGMDGCTKARAMEGYRARSQNSSDHFVYVCEFYEFGSLWTWETSHFINDTYGVPCPEVAGEIVDGMIYTRNKYVCDNGSFREVNDVEKFFGLGCVDENIGAYQTPVGRVSAYKCTESGWIFDREKNVQKDALVDSRDLQTYDVVEIENQTWMAENLNYEYNEGTAVSHCYDLKAENCAISGRLYTWAAAMDSAAKFGSNSSGCGYAGTCVITQPARGVCPEGWHIPTKDEWSTLFSFAEKDGTLRNISVGTLLKSTTGWGTNGNDTYGFAALPSNGSSAVFWTSSEYSSGYAYNSCIYNSSPYSDYTTRDSHKGGAYSVRCLKDSN